MGPGIKPPYFRSEIWHPNNCNSTAISHWWQISNLRNKMWKNWRAYFGERGKNGINKNNIALSLIRCGIHCNFLHPHTIQSLQRGSEGTLTIMVMDICVPHISKLIQFCDTLQYSLWGEIRRQPVKAPLAAAISPYYFDLTHPSQAWMWKENRPQHHKAPPTLHEQWVGSLTSHSVD